MRTYVADTVGKVGETVTVKGWVNSRRDHGGLIFIDLRDHTGLVQITISPEKSGPEQLATGEKIRDEFVLEVTGKVIERATELVNPNIETGGIEIVAQN